MAGLHPQGLNAGLASGRRDGWLDRFGLSHLHDPIRHGAGLLFVFILRRTASQFGLQDRVKCRRWSEGKGRRATGGVCVPERLGSRLWSLERGERGHQD
jgi:hypothetical protein